MMFTLRDYQLRHSRVFPTAADYLTGLKFWCKVPAYTLKDDTPIETLPTNASVDALSNWMRLMGMDPTPLYTQNIGEEKSEVDLSRFPGNPEWSHFLNRTETKIREAKGLFGPIWEPLEGPNSFQRSAIPISRMVELTYNKTEFYLEDDFDVAPILYRVDEYLIAVEKRLHETEIKEYVKKLLEFREKFYDNIFLKVMNKHPDLAALYREEYYQKCNPLEMLEVTHQIPDCFVALRRPPVTLPIDEPDTEITEDFYHEKSSFETSYLRSDQ